MSRPNEPPLPDPLAYYLTWTTYGTWLPGDERGWMKRGRGLQVPDPIRKIEAQARMTEDACRLDQEQRAVVENTIAEHCRIRGWELYAKNCRSNHVHVVVAADIKPEAVRNQFKAWCTRKLKEFQRHRQGQRDVRENWWTERGSRLYINDADGLDAVIQYVNDGQDDPQTRREHEARIAGKDRGGDRPYWPDAPARESGASDMRIGRIGVASGNGRHAGGVKACDAEWTLAGASGWYGWMPATPSLARRDGVDGCQRPPRWRVGMVWMDAGVAAKSRKTRLAPPTAELCAAN